MTDHLYDEVAALRLELAKVKMERDMASGPLNEAGRAAVTKYLRAADTATWSEDYESFRDQCAGKHGTHDQLCELGYLLRRFGGQPELERQMNLSHAEAIRLERIRVKRLKPREHEADWGDAGGFTCKYCRESMHLLVEGESCEPWKGNWWDQ